MAVHRQHKQSDLEKRLRILRSSLNVDEPRTSGDNSEKGRKSSIYKMPTASSGTSHQTQTSTAIVSDVTYLRKDLLKIVIFSGLAFAIQAGIYFGLQKDFIKIPNF